MNNDNDNGHKTDATIEANKAAASQVARLHGRLGRAIQKLPSVAADETGWILVSGEAFDHAVAIINALNLPAGASATVTADAAPEA